MWPVLVGDHSFSGGAASAAVSAVLVDSRLAPMESPSSPPACWPLRLLLFFCFPIFSDRGLPPLLDAGLLPPLLLEDLLLPLLLLVGLALPLLELILLLGRIPDRDFVK